MNANTVYEVFLALTPDEKEKFIALINEQKLKASFKHKKEKKETSRIYKAGCYRIFASDCF